MNQAKYSLISHKGLALCNPINSVQIDRLINQLPLQPHQRVVDFGAGKGEFLIRLVKKYGVSATAVELEGGLITELPGLIKGRVAPSQIEAALMAAEEFLAESMNRPFDVAACIGSVHAFGGYQNALNALSKSVKPGGYIVIGDLYWKRSPDPGFLSFLQCSADSYMTQAEQITQAERLGLVPLWCCSASEEDWDNYEWHLHLSRENYVRKHPDDVDSSQILERGAAWRSAYLSWGRATFGFGLYLLKKDENQNQ